MVIDLPHLAEIRTTDRADEKYFELCGIRPERTETDQHGVIVSVYANSERIRKAIHEYWRKAEGEIIQRARARKT